MTIVDMIKKLAAKKDESGNKFKEMQEADRLETMLQERKKSSNRRELEKYYKDKEEAEVKRRLDIIRKKRNHDAWKGESILKSNYNILKDDKKVFSKNKSLLSKSNTFLSSNKIPTTKTQQFFKW